MAAVGGDGAGRGARSASSPSTAGFTWAVGGIAGMDVSVDDDAGDVVTHRGAKWAELGRLPPARTQMLIMHPSDYGE